MSININASTATPHASTLDEAPSQNTSTSRQNQSAPSSARTVTGPLAVLASIGANSGSASPQTRRASLNAAGGRATNTQTDTPRMTRQTSKPSFQTPPPIQSDHQARPAGGASVASPHASGAGESRKDHEHFATSLSDHQAAAFATMRAQNELAQIQNQVALNQAKNSLVEELGKSMKALVQ